MKVTKQTIKLNKEADLIEVSSCPHCNSTSIVRNGHKKDKQQYKCRNCNKSFQATTGTPIHGLHLKDRIPKYIKALKQGMTIRAAANYAEISKNTSFSWRHKFLSSIKNEPIIKETNKTNTVTVLKLPYSAKGRVKAPEKNRKNTTTIIVQHNNQISIKKLDTKHINRQISETLEKTKIICHVKNREITKSLKKIAKNQILQQKKLKNQNKQQINNQIEKLSIWMKRFRGVATKYLQQYWNWYVGLQNVQFIKNEDNHFTTLCIENQTLNIYRQLRKQ